MGSVVSTLEEEKHYSRQDTFFDGWEQDDGGRDRNALDRRASSFITGTVSLGAGSDTPTPSVGFLSGRYSDDFGDLVEADLERLS